MLALTPHRYLVGAAGQRGRSGGITGRGSRPARLSWSRRQPALGPAPRGRRAGGGDVARGRATSGGRCRSPPRHGHHPAAARPLRQPRRRPRTRSAWSASTRRGAAATARSSRASGRSSPATGCAACSGGVSLRTGTPARRPARSPRRTPACCCWSTAASRSAVSGGVTGAASTLDVAVRAAGAVAEHYLARGDRVGLRVLGSTGRNAVHDRRGPPAPAAGAGHAGPRRTGGEPRRRPGPDAVPGAAPAASCWCSRRCCPRSRWRPPPRSPRAASTWWSWTACPSDVEVGDDQRLALAWRMRLLEREALLGRAAPRRHPGGRLARPGHARRGAAPAGPPRRHARGGPA